MMQMKGESLIPTRNYGKSEEYIVNMLQKWTN